MPIHAAADRVEPFRDPDGVRRRLTYLAQLEAGATVPGHQAYRTVLARFPRERAGLEEETRRILERYGTQWVRA